MQLKLQEIRAEVGDIITFIFEPLEQVSWLAGQYINLTMPDVPPVDSDRLFTIASAPHEQHIQITTYPGESSYKQRMIQLQPGDIIEADQLGGDFTWNDAGRQKVYVAGGIGVTTFRSIILDQIYRGIPNDAVLLYAGKDDRRPFVGELQEAAQNDSTLTIKDYVTTRLTLERLLADVTDVYERTVYLAGSQSFSEMIGEGLIQNGMPRTQIKYDYFDGYESIEY